MSAEMLLRGSAAATDRVGVGTLAEVARARGQRYEVSVWTPLRDVLGRFEREPELAGVILTQDGAYRNALARTAVQQRMSQAFQRDLFFNRSLAHLLESWPIPALVLDEDLEVSEAMTRAVQRPVEQRFDPVVVRQGDGSHRLLPMYELLVAQCDRLSVALGELQAQKQATQQAQALRDQMHQRLVEASRQAGMAEIAASILHNVGNVLNSVNVATTVVTDKLRQSRSGNLGKAVALMQAHAEDLPAFLTQDAKGRQLPDYLARLAECLNKEQQTLLEEMDHIGRSLEHIKNIVGAQQAYARGTLVKQQFDLKEVLEDALRFNMTSLERHRVEVRRRYEFTPVLHTDKHLVLQILVNLVNNAKKAVRDCGRPDQHRIEVALLSVQVDGRAVARIEVTDNGIGIAPENLARVFTLGFTTRPDGHGIGLHNSANAARQLGGTLTVHSAGLGQGATFTLDLPIHAKELGENTYESDRTCSLSHSGD